ncbi:S1 RNA-binding domain-containing protein 1 isoform X3 [Hydra vulgaris]|uniref:S1 RNA-binding domain-containing protein 1 isoform X3 n=1 Tax=Hydra vulgaris TaxID=6087 RepID=A0ABM4D4L6_HYDVU
MPNINSLVIDEYLTDEQTVSLNSKSHNVSPKSSEAHKVTHISNVINLLEQDLTVPYIARYRKHETGCMEAENIRRVQEIYEKYKNLEIEAEKVIKKIKNEASEDIISSIKAAKSIEEIKELYAPFKKKRKGTLAERAQSLGLNAAAIEIFRNPEKTICFQNYLDYSNELTLETQVKTGIMHILAHQISVNIIVKAILDREIGYSRISITTKASTKGIENDKKRLYENYYKFSSLLSQIYSHQVLAINRAEHQKVLSVKLDIKEDSRRAVINQLIQLHIPNKCSDSYRHFMIEVVNDAFARLIEKSFLIRIRKKLNKLAEKEALDVFIKNLKHLYLAAPVKNRVILSIDPGFKNGCKIALLDKNGFVLETCVIFPFKNKLDSFRILAGLIKKYQVEIVALGNGTACRETEQFISQLIKEEKLDNLRYCIVCESGASVYSVTEEAKLEFGNMDPNLISAVSIGRRLQDPLLELVKIDAKHAGVGMYQHDLNSGVLQKAVDAVIEDCVSFIGVDINACSAQILRCVTGINKKHADAIIEYRNKHGGFVNREELKSVKGIGPVTFRNCAGFIRVNIANNSEVNTTTTEDVETNSSLITRKRKLKKDEISNKKAKYTVEPLDKTWIHPEQYPLAYKLLSHLGVSSLLIGSKDMKNTLGTLVNTDEQFNRLLDYLKTDKEVLKLILDGLSQPFDFDPREGFETPLFKTGLTSMTMLTIGCMVSGAVRNCTSFGVFVDIGVETDGLIPNRYMLPNVLVGPGDRVECKVLGIDTERKRVSLSLIKKLSLELRLQ